MILPSPLRWGAGSARDRGPVVTAPDADRNAVGVFAGGFAAYRALGLATGQLPRDHRPDYAGTAPSVGIGPFPQWSDPARIVTFDPWGHRVACDFADGLAVGRSLRPSIAITSGHLDIPEIRQLHAAGRLRSDGRVLTDRGDIAVTKIAIEPVWYLPGIAARLDVAETVLRHAMMEAGGGTCPDLVDRPDLPLFLPPIGGTSVYLMGDPARLGQPDTRVACRIHDECNGSDVFGSDLCTCRPYLIEGIEAGIRTAQRGGIGIVVYSRKEGRALGEVVKFLVYNARRSSTKGDLAEDYFRRTSQVAGVEDLRMQALSADVLHWLGVTRIATWVSMSNLKSDALRAAGIAIDGIRELPEARIPRNAGVEIGAKIAAGYHTEARCAGS